MEDSSPYTNADPCLALASTLLSLTQQVFDRVTLLFAPNLQRRNQNPPLGYLILNRQFRVRVCCRTVLR